MAFHVELGTSTRVRSCPPPVHLLQCVPGGEDSTVSAKNENLFEKNG